MFWKRTDPKTAELEAQLAVARRQVVQLLNLSYRQKARIKELESQGKEGREAQAADAQETDGQKLDA